ncbi:diguanylate cyclase domain-containing protein [Thioflexithrix psekupsensis]|nr:PleD family two-component system response regulator [Thioflexithrix psekupsensis]
MTALKHREFTVLVVDDVASNIKFLHHFLSGEGFNVQVAQDGEDCLQTVDYAPPDLILLDIMLPGVDGFEVSKRLKSNPKTAQIPIIFMTALSDMNSKIRGFDAGASDYITKPLEPREVLARISVHLKLHRLQQELAKSNRQLQHQLETTKVLKNKLIERSEALEEANRELERLVHLDGLTQVANRRRLDRYLEKEWPHLAKEKGYLSAILCDIDYFKLYNDTHGHIEGDECLKQVAKTIEWVVHRPADLVARYGGEEFIVLLPHTDLQGVLHVAENIRQAIQALQVPHSSSKVAPYVTVSMGVHTVIPTSHTDAASLLRPADRALYAAKKQGRNRVVVYDTSLESLFSASS